MTGVSAAGTTSLTIRAPPGERSTILHEASRLSLGTKKRPAISTRARRKWRRSAFARSTTLLRSLVMASASDTAWPLKNAFALVVGPGWSTQGYRDRAIFGVVHIYPCRF